MAGNHQISGTGRQGEQRQPRSGRASKAVGDPKEKLMQSTSLQQQANVSKRSASSRGTARTPAATKATPAKGKSPGTSGAKGTRNAGKTGKSGASGNTKRTPTSKTSRLTPVGPRNDPRDTRFIQWASDRWNGLEPHHQQGVFSTCLLILSLLLFGSLTVFQTAPILSGIHGLFLTLFGWSAYLLALGLVAFALAHLIEGIRRQQFVRLSLVAGLVCIWLLLLIESALIMGPSDNVGILGELLVNPFLGWSRSVGHVVVLGLLLITSIVTFRLTFGHVLIVMRGLKRLFADPILSINLSGGKVGRNRNMPAQKRSSPFLGQRPQYSRYSAVGSLNGNDEVDDEEFEAQDMPMLAQNRQSWREQALPLQDDELDIEVELEDDDDPLNDINIHKQHVGLVPRDTRTARASLILKNTSRLCEMFDNNQLPFEQAQGAGERDRRDAFTSIR